MPTYDLTHSLEQRLPRVKNLSLEKRLFRRRALLSLVLVLGALGALVTQLSYLQIANHEHFATLSENNRIKLKPLPPTRGSIFDRNGVLLADNLPSYRLEITPEAVPDMETTLAELGTQVELSDTDLERFRKLLKRSPAHESIPLRFRLSDVDVARLSVDLHRFPGVAIQAGLTRYYPLGAHAVHVLGYVGRIDERDLQRIDTSQYRGSTHIGKNGVERSYEALLHGGVGHQQVETNAQGRPLRVLDQSLPAPGKNIYLTIDSRLQSIAEQVLEGYNGAIVAIDPRNGEILALASMPGYDPNLFVNGIDVPNYKALISSRDRPLFNRALRGVYPPGSTVKPIVGLAGLEYGVTTPGKPVYCRGFYRLPGHTHRFRDWRRGGHGRVGLDRGITESCDVYFYELAHNMGIDRMHEYLMQFNLGQLTGVDLPGEKPGLMPSRDWKREKQNKPWFPGETLIAGIGQGYMLATPLQLAHSTATLAQGGRGFRPRILYASQEQESNELELEPVRPLPQRRARLPELHGRRETWRTDFRTVPYVRRPGAPLNTRASFVVESGRAGAKPV
ncbi:MAG: penicillin-binding protein 2 [Candidatus Competibacteraceae bacterium]|nr:penicillin-binding protein 2 [Candidatus Competibacteraceae bacterium]